MSKNKSTYDRFIDWFESKREKFSRSKLVDTSVTLSTKYLQKELKSFFNLNVKLSVSAILSAIITAISFVNPFSDNVNNFLNVSNIELVEWIPIILVVITILLSLSALFSTVKTGNTTKFVNKMIEDQFDVEEHTAIFIIKMVFDNIPKILVFRSETWNSYFLPYCHYDKKLSSIRKSEDLKEYLKRPLAEILEISENDFEISDDFTKKDYVTIKRNPSHEAISKINYKFFYVKFKNPYARQKFINSNNSFFSWKSKYELSKDKDTQINNGDVLDIIDELSLINQSKVAFKDKKPSSYEISSRYRIIWNITSECYFNCNICATNSGNTSNFKCKLSNEDKLKVLINLSSINGNIDELDISGGDPLKNASDRNIIKKVNQLFPYTKISVTTTGKALEKIAVDELIQTVKVCDITYDIPYNICLEEFKKYREYKYNYINFKQLERFSNSGINIALNVHIPILPVSIDREIVATILEDLSKINPVQVKFIRLMPVGRMKLDDIPKEYNIQKFINYVEDIVQEKGYDFKLSYNCSLGVKVLDSDLNVPCRKCEMLTNKLGIDAQGHVYSCIWGAYINEFKDKDPKQNPFYLGDLKSETLYDILTSPKVIKMKKQLEEKGNGCRVCGYVADKNTYKDSFEHMLNGVDSLQEIQSSLILKK